MSSETITENYANDIEALVYGHLNWIHGQAKLAKNDGHEKFVRELNTAFAEILNAYAILKTSSSVGKAFPAPIPDPKFLSEGPYCCSETSCSCSTKND